MEFGKDVQIVHETPMPIDWVVIRFTKQCDVNHESIYQLGGVWWGSQNGIFLRPQGFHGSANGGVHSCFN